MCRCFADVGAWAVHPSVVHGPVERSRRQLCDHCRGGTTAYVCAACGKHLHIRCFVAATMYTWSGTCWAEQDGGGNGGLCYPTFLFWYQCEPSGNHNRRIGWILNCEDATPHSLPPPAQTQSVLCPTRPTRPAHPPDWLQWWLPKHKKCPARRTRSTCRRRLGLISCRHAGRVRVALSINECSRAKGLYIHKGVGSHHRGLKKGGSFATCNVYPLWTDLLNDYAHFVHFLLVLLLVTCPCARLLCLLRQENH